ncbi:AI-2E family transporter [Desulfitibacter alkalitolerans]|uniref:AI-2E family transporter n=1 Tax=Desulfitibacter alkalitolerans TaxID=264641 RepID=UPI000487BDF7|nr:AI-2E family transporter [Desulfitibacter alkalitolerans]
MNVKFLNFSKRTRRVLLLIGALLLGVYFLYIVRVILPPFILALVLAYLLNPLVTNLEKKGFKRTLAILIVYTSVLGGITLIIIYAFPVIAREIDKFSKMVPVLTIQLQESITNFYENYQRVQIPESLRQVIDDTISNFEQFLIASLDAFAERILGIFSGLVIILLSPILAFYILKDKNILGERVMGLFPAALRREVSHLWKEIDRILTKFIRGHLLVAFLVGLMMAVGLTIIDVRFAILLGIISGLFDLIPYFGPVLGALPAFIMALLDSPIKALYVLILMVAVQQIESNILSPKILGESVGLHPLTVIFVVLAGGHLFGLLGLLIAVPVTAVTRIIINYWVDKMMN